MPDYFPNVFQSYSPLSSKRTLFCLNNDFLIAFPITLLIIITSTRIISIEIMNLLMKINRLGKTVIVVTHEKNLVDYYKQRVVMLRDGKIVEDRVGGMFK